jgi:hypothetical protein
VPLFEHVAGQRGASSPALVGHDCDLVDEMGVLGPDFLFPQMVSPEMGPEHWEPRYLDYLYTSFTNVMAFSPTDTMPLSRGRSH